MCLEIRKSLDVRKITVSLFKRICQANITENSFSKLILMLVWNFTFDTKWKALDFDLISSSSTLRRYIYLTNIVIISKSLWYNKWPSRAIAYLICSLSCQLHAFSLFQCLCKALCSGIYWQYHFMHSTPQCSIWREKERTFWAPHTAPSIVYSIHGKGGGWVSWLLQIFYPQNTIAMFIGCPGLVHLAHNLVKLSHESDAQWLTHPHPQYFSDSGTTEVNRFTYR